MGVENPQSYMKQTQQPFSGDPVTENMVALKGGALQARPDQNHDAHIITHGTFLQNPMYKSNPQVQQILMSHIQDHLALKYRQEMAQMIPDARVQQMIMSQQQLPPELENELALVAANASDSVLQLNEAKMKILEGEQKDPHIEIQEKDLALRAQKMMNDLKVEEDKIALKEAEMIIDDENKDDDRKLRLTEKAMDVAARTGANKVILKTDGDI